MIWDSALPDMSADLLFFFDDFLPLGKARKEPRVDSPPKATRRHNTIRMYVPLVYVNREARCRTLAWAREHKLYWEETDRFSVFFRLHSPSRDVLYLPEDYKKTLPSPRETFHFKSIAISKNLTGRELSELRLTRNSRTGFNPKNINQRRAFLWLIHQYRMTKLYVIPKKPERLEELSLKPGDRPLVQWKFEDKRKRIFSSVNGGEDRSVELEKAELLRIFSDINNLDRLLTKALEGTPDHEYELEIFRASITD
ncbi:hypothetical protein F5Y16DRAFT_255859 [Xylariaceae sp. FL0255]|nr:hypothetical protein F5Y16DRAFT_255859 [Xylariaceae sp. FL0255]